jgi:pyruvate dehydrogenase E2 component (dihydrolipoamide acetyltransferase)
MAIQILMPALSPTMTEGTLARWLVAEGDNVSSGDVIAEIETDKATMEVEALDDGVIAKIMVSEATENVAVNAVIALMTEEGESLSDADLASASAALQKAAPASALDVAPASSTAPAPSATSAPQAPAQAGRNAGRVFASPLARRIAAQNDIDITAITGTGPQGRIIRADVEEALSQGAVPAQKGRGIAGASEPRFVPHTAMRRVIAQRLQSSKQTAPHFYLTVECEIDSLLAARKQLNEFAPEGVKISVNDMIIKAAGYALMAEPDMNGFYAEDGCSYYDTADICMAVAVDGGLVTPVIQSVEKAGLADIAAITADLASRARAGTLDPSEYAGGNFTISNLGMFGIKEFSAVINPPQSGILAIGAGEQRPIVKSGELAIATMMSVTLSADHRIVDGAVGARWLQAFKRAIETPAIMLL